MARKGSFSDWLRWDAEAEQKRKQAQETKRVREIQQATGKKVADVVYNKKTGLQEVRNYTGGNTARSVQNTYEKSKATIQGQRDLYNYTSGGLRPNKEQTADTKDWRATRRDDGSEDAYRYKLKNVPDNELTFLERQFKYGRIGLDALEPRSSGANREKGYLVEVDRSVAKGKKSRTDRNTDGDLFVDRFDIGMSVDDAEEASSSKFAELSDAEIMEKMRKTRNSRKSGDQFTFQSLLIEQQKRAEQNGSRKLLDQVKGSDKANDSVTDFTQSMSDLQSQYEYARQVGEQTLRPVAKEKEAQPIRDMFKRGLGIGQTTDMYNEEQQRRAQYVGQRSEEEFGRYASAPENQEKLLKKEEAIQKERQRLQEEYLAAGGQMNEREFERYVNQRGQKLMQLQVERDQETEAMRSQFLEGGGRKAIEQEYEEMTANKAPEDDGFLSTLKRRGVDAAMVPVALSQGAAAGVAALIPGALANKVEDHYASAYEKQVRDNIYLRALNVAGDAITGGVIGNVDERVSGEQAAYRQDSKRLTGAEELGAGIVGGLSGSLVGYGAASKAVIAGSARGIGAKFGQEVAETYAQKMRNGFLEDMFIGAALDVGFGLGNQLTDQDEGIDTVQLASEVVVGTLIGGGFRGAIEIPGLHARHLETKRAEQEATRLEAIRQTDLERERRERDTREKAMDASEYESLVNRRQQTELRNATKASYKEKMDRVKADAERAMTELGQDPTLPMQVNKKMFDSRLIGRLDQAVKAKSFDLAPRQEQLDALYNVFGELVDRVDTLRAATLDKAGAKVRADLTHELVQVQQALDDAIGTEVPLAFKYKVQKTRSEDQFNLRDMYERFPNGDVPAEHLESYMRAIEFADKMTGYKTTPAPVKVAYNQIAEQMRTNLRDFAELKAQQEVDIEAQKVAQLTSALKEVGVQKSASIIEEMRTERESLTLQRRKADKIGNIPKEDIDTLNEWFNGVPPEEKLRLNADLDIRFNKDGSISRRQKNHTIDQLVRLYINSSEQLDEFNNREPLPMFQPKKKVGQKSFNELTEDEMFEFKQKVEQQYLEQGRTVKMLGTEGDWSKGEGFIPELDANGDPLFVEMKQEVVSESEVVEVPGDTFRVDFMGSDDGKFVLRKLVNMTKVEREFENLQYRNERALMPIEDMTADAQRLQALVERGEEFVKANGIDITSPEARQFPEVQELDKNKSKLARRMESIKILQEQNETIRELGLENYLVPQRNAIAVPLPSEFAQHLDDIQNDRSFFDNQGNILTVSAPKSVDKLTDSEQVGAEAVEDLIVKSTTSQDVIGTGAERTEAKQRKKMTAKKLDLSISSISDIRQTELNLNDLLGSRGKQVRQMLKQYAEVLETKGNETLNSTMESLKSPYKVKMFGEDFLKEQAIQAANARDTAPVLRTIADLTDQQLKALVNKGKDNAEVVQNRLKLYEPMMKDPALQLTEHELEVYKQWQDVQGKSFISVKQIADTLVNLTREHSEMFDRYVDMQDRSLDVKYNDQDAKNFIENLSAEITRVYIDKGERINPQATQIIIAYEQAYSKMQVDPQAASVEIDRLNKMVEEQYPNAIERVRQRQIEAQSVGTSEYETLEQMRDDLKVEMDDIYDEAFATAAEASGVSPKALQSALNKWFKPQSVDGVKVKRIPTNVVDLMEEGKLIDEVYDTLTGTEHEKVIPAVEAFIEELSFGDLDVYRQLDIRFNEIANNIGNKKKAFTSGNKKLKGVDERIAYNVELYNKAREAARVERIEAEEWQGILNDQATYARISKNFKYNIHDPAFNGAIPKGLWSSEPNGASSIEDVARYINENNIDAPGVRESLEAPEFDPTPTIEFLARLDERKSVKRDDVVSDPEWVKAVRSALVTEMNLKFPTLEDLDPSDIDAVNAVREQLARQMRVLTSRFESEPELKAYNALKKSGLLEGKEVETVEFVRKMVDKVVPREVQIPFREVSKFLPHKYADIEAAASKMDRTPQELIDALHDYIPLQKALDDMDAQIGQRDMELIDAISSETEFFGQGVEFRQQLDDAEIEEILAYRDVLNSSTLQDPAAETVGDVRRIIEDYIGEDTKNWVAQKYMDPDNPSTAKIRELEQLERMDRDERLEQLRQQKELELKAIREDELAAREALKEYGNVSPIDKWKATARPDNDPMTKDLRKLHDAMQQDVNGVKQLLPDYTVKLRQYLFSKFARISTWDRSLEKAGHKLTPGTRLLDRFEQIGGRSKARFEQKFDEKYLPVLDYFKEFNLSPDDIGKLYKDLANWSNLKWNDEVKMNGMDEPLIRVIPYSADETGGVIAPKDANEWYESNILPWQNQGIDIDRVLQMTKKVTDDQLERMHEAGFITEDQLLDMKKKAKYGYIPLVPKGKKMDLNPFREALDPAREYTQQDHEALAGAQSPLNVLLAREHRLAGREEVNRVANLLHTHVTKLVESGYDLSDHVKPLAVGEQPRKDWGEVLVAYRKGQDPIRYQMSKEYDTMFKYGMEDMGRIEKMLLNISRMDASLMTSRNPVFGLKSLIRDPLTAMQVSGVETVVLDLIPSMIEGFVGSVARRLGKPQIMDKYYRSPLGKMASEANYQALDERGAVPNSVYDFFGYKPEENTVDQVLHQTNASTTRKVFQNLDNTIKFLSDWAEASSRLIVGRAEFRRTKNIDDAATAATSMLNFANAGTYREGTGVVAKVSRMMQFVNPALQGTYGYAKAVKRNPIRTLSAASVILAPLAYELATRDEWSEEQQRKYAMLTDYERANNIFFPVGDDFIKFPIPPGIESFPASVIRQIFDQKDEMVPGRTNEEVVKGSGKLLLNSLFPQYEANLPIIQPLLEVATNYSRFYEGEIVKDHDKDAWTKRDGTQEFEDSNTLLAIKLAELTGVDHPKKIDYLIDNMPLNELTSPAIDLIDVKLRDMKGIDKKVGNYQVKRDSYATGYDYIDQVLDQPFFITRDKVRQTFYVGDDAKVNFDAAFELYDEADKKFDLGRYPTEEETAAEAEFLAPAYEASDFLKAEKEAVADGADREDIEALRKDQRKFMFDFLQNSNK